MNESTATAVIKWERRAAKGRLARENALDVLRQAFNMRMPEARENGERLRDRHHLAAINLEKQAELIKAKAERHLSYAEKVGKILEANKNRNLIRARHGATPEVLVKPRARDPIAMLVEKGRLDGGQERAAREIARIYQAIVVALMPKITSLEAGGGPGRGSPADRMPEKIAMWHHDRYLPWTRALANKDDTSLPLIIDVAVDGLSVNTACRYRRVGYVRGVRLIAQALSLYDKYRALAPGA
jgi:hypothetical protein